MKRYYPVGTIVRLEDLDPKYFMIAGYLPKREDSKIYDYFGVIFPLGMKDASDYICFDHDSITEVIHTGYCNEACQNLLDGFCEYGENLMSAFRELKARSQSTNTKDGEHNG